MCCSGIDLDAWTFFWQGALIQVWIPPMSIYTRVLCCRWSYYGCSILYVFWQVGYQWAVYATTLRSRVKGWLDILRRLLLSQWSSSDMNFQPRGWLNTTGTIVNAVDYDFGICGIYMSDIAISSRSCTERHGDFSESVVFHSSYEVSCFLFVVCLFLVGLFGFCFCCLFVLVAAWLLDERHLRYRFTLFSCVGMDNLNQWIDDRQSFERARHRQKKKWDPNISGAGRHPPAVTASEKRLEPKCR